VSATGDEAHDELLAANARFYEGFESLDLDVMSAVWSHSESASCVHPGAEMVTGWPRVRRSWAAIFANTEYLQFIVTDEHAEVLGPDAGVVTCTENILSDAGHDDHLGAARAVATNVFVRDPQRGWVLLTHHASPVLRRDVSEGE